MSPVRVLASGIDTLHLFTRALVRDDAATAIGVAKEPAASSPRA
jgi:hypothetical protein